MVHRVTDPLWEVFWALLLMAPSGRAGLAAGELQPGPGVLGGTTWVVSFVCSPSESAHIWDL